MAMQSILTRLAPVSASLLLLFGGVAMVPVVTAADSAIAQTAKPAKKKIAIVDFDFANTGDSSYWYSYRGTGAARGISEMLINKLVNDGAYTVVSRSALENLLREKGISGPIDESKAVMIGKELGVDTVIVGTVTRFNVEKRSAGGSLFGIGGGSDTTKAVVQLAVRAVSVQDQSIIAAMEGLGNEESSSGRGSVFGIGASSSSSGSDELLSQAAEKAVANVVTQMKQKL